MADTIPGSIRTYAFLLALVMIGFAALAYQVTDGTTVFVPVGFVWLAAGCAIVGGVAQAICKRQERRIETESGLVY